MALSNLVLSLNLYDDGYTMLILILKESFVALPDVRIYTGKKPFTEASGFLPSAQSQYLHYWSLSSIITC